MPLRGDALGQCLVDHIVRHEQFALAEKYGLLPYLLPTFVGLAPGEWHRQMISEAETNAFQVLVGIEPPPSTLSAEERQIGGLGVFLTKNVMDEVHYEYRDGQNVLTMKKRG